jgi:hypothetical protein
MIKDFKKVKDDLKNYYINNNKKFWNRQRMNQIIKKTLNKTKYFWLLIIILLILTIKPDDKILSSKFSFIYTIYAPQLILFLLFTSLFVVVALVFFTYITDEYNNYLSRTYKSFLKIMKLFISFSVLALLILIANAQVYYINNLLIPPLESCTYYDFYGHELFASEKIGECPALRNLEVIYDVEVFDKVTIKFGVLMSNKYTSYEYVYDDNKIVKQSKSIYELIKNEYDNFNLEVINYRKPNRETIIVDIYNENEFISQRISITGNTKTNTEIVSRLNDNNEIVVTFDDHIYDEFLPVELYRFIKSENQIKLDHQYTLTKVDNESNTMIEKYDSIFYDQAIINLSFAEYNYFRVEDEIFPILSSLTNYNGVNYQYRVNSINEDVDYIDQKANNTLIYRNIIENNEIGFRVMHYSYRRDKKGKFININTLNQDDYCYANNYLKTDFDYIDITNSRNITFCGENLFYTINPILLEY